MKKKCAVFTIVKNEKFFLPIWLKHYKKFFQNEDIYILDHQTEDESTNDLDVNVTVIHNDVVFDHEWLLATVKNFQAKLLEKYEVVVFAECDELIYSPTFNLNTLIDKFIEDSTQDYLTCKGFELMQDIDTEGPLANNEEIIKHRNHWFKFPLYDKTLISKIPISWTIGFHVSSEPLAFGYDLRLIHLHRCDFNTMVNRNKERLANAKKVESGVHGEQNKIVDLDWLLGYHNQYKHIMEVIPNIDKIALQHI